MIPVLTHRSLIIGNSGSGKSTLAAQITAFAECPNVSLDQIYWVDQLALTKRGAVAAKKMAAEIADQPRWVIEGVYGWLIDAVTPRATALIWLDLPWPDCRAGLVARGPMGVTDAEFDDLLTWAQAYSTRQTPSSHCGHAKIFGDFAGKKVRLTSRADVEAFVAPGSRVFATLRPG